MIYVILISYGELYPVYVDGGKVSLILLTVQLGKTTLTCFPSQSQYHLVNCLYTVKMEGLFYFCVVTSVSYFVSLL